MFNIAKKIGWETFWDSVKFTWNSTFVDGLGPRDAIEIKPKSNTALEDLLIAGKKRHFVIFCKIFQGTYFPNKYYSIFLYH